MGPDNFCSVLVFLGIVVTYTNGVDGFDSQRRQIMQNNSNIHRTHPRLSHDRLKTISKHVLRTFDTSCVHIPLPEIPNGRVVKMHKRKFRMKNERTKDYLMAEFKCQKGFSLANKRTHGKMFCSRSKWIGRKPLCKKSAKGLPTRVGECPAEHKVRCKHLCYILNGEPTCGCPVGLQRVGNDCRDINECEDPKIKIQCPFGCSNSIGSYYCPNSPEDSVLADEPSKDTKIEQNDEKGEEYDDYEEDDYDENYDEEKVEGDKNDTKPTTDSKSENERVTLGTTERSKETEINDTNNETLTNSEQKTDKTIDSKNDKDSDSYDDDDYEEGDYDDEYDEDTETNIGKEATTPKTTTQSGSASNQLISNEISVENESESMGHGSVTTSATLKNKIDENISEKKSYDEETEEVKQTTTVATTTTIKIDLIEPKSDNLGTINGRGSETDKNNVRGISEEKEITAEVDENHDDMDEEETTLTTTTSSSPHEETSSSDKVKVPESNTSSYEDKNNDIFKEGQDKNDNNAKVVGKETDEEYEETDYDEDYDETTTETTTNSPLDITEPSETMNNTNINISRRHDTSKTDSNEEEGIAVDPTEDKLSNSTERTNDHTIESDEDDFEYDPFKSTSLESGVNITPTEEKNTAPEESTIRIGTDEESPRRSKPADNNYDYDDDDDDYEEYEDAKTEGSELVKTCQDGYKLDEKDACTDIDECNPDTNPCSDKCQNTLGSYICSCPSGFRPSPADSHVCQDIDECQSSPCSHDCINSEGSYKCDCPQGLTLQNTTCANLTCSHGETKVNSKVQCTCPSGYVLGFDNRTCEDVNECLLVNDCAHSCHNTEGSYECSCRPGFVLENERLCIDIDECQGDHGCPHNCENEPGSFKCSCREGYEFVNATNSCIDIDECDELRDLDECNQICINYEGGYECGCRDGFKLGPDDATCEDIKECAVNNGNCSQICEDLPGSYACKCIKNYSLNQDNRTCRIVDPCLSENGGCSHFCLNNNGSVRCGCPEDHELSLNRQTCTRINPCTIRNGGCSHFCEFVNGRASCLCPELHTLQNETRCVEINPCWENNGGCSHICRFEDHKQSCLCPLTHELRNKTHCLEKNPCLMENGGCSDNCHFSKGVVSCSCPENYYLEGKTCYRNDPCLVGNGGCSHECFSDEDGNVKCLCPRNFVLQTNQKICVPQDLCLLNNGNCSHICDSNNNQVTCSCPEGYQLQNRTQCVQHNPCLVNNGGCSDICENIYGKAKCACPDNYALEDDKNCVILDNCLEDNGGCSHICKTIDKQIQCACPDRYNLVNQTKCVPLNPCFINNGGCSHECSSDGSKAICACPDGHELQGKTCIPINPCDKKNGGCSHVCRSVNGLLACECPPGFELIDKTCFKKNPCSIDNGGCSHGCANARGQAKCSCPPGYKLFAKTCLDDDPCKKNNGGCSHFCHSKEGKRECSCPDGYLLRPNRRVCKEVNECRVNRGGCSHGCKNLPGSYQCTCPFGLKLDQLNNKTCADIDECRIDNGKCEMICRNFRGGHKCDCPEGYNLQKDRRSCKLVVETQCRVPLAPKHGVMRCSDQIMDHGTLVPSGTRCNFWCNEGYKLKGTSPRQCSSSGKWESEEPKCIVATCPKLPPIKNGWYLPGVCNSGRTYSGESCEIYCRKGFRLRQEIEKYVCDANMQWMPNVRPEHLQDACVSGLPNIYLKCPKNGHIEFILPEGQRHMVVKIPRPETSIDWTYVTSQPSWGTRLETTLPAGRTEVRFTAVSPSDFNTTASCHLVINVLDRELPKVTDCPSNIERTLPRGRNMQIVHWREPRFSDNVGVATVYKSREPGGEFGQGIHHITYVGSDEAGNRAFCHFSINIRDDLDMEESNSVPQYSSTYANHNSAGKYRAVLICPSGVQYMSNPPDSYNNMLTREAGCYWRHVKVTRPMQPQNFKVPKVYTESRLPPNMRTNRRVFFKWNR